MGHEHEIYFDLTIERRNEIEKLLKGHPLFSEIVKYKDYDSFEFRRNKADKGMPDFSISIIKEGLYICHYLKSKAWADIGFILQYLIENKLQYQIEEL